ncbi:protein ADP-ribosyltransferase PARP3-like isoform X2 [Pistacia vera]|uniref:protein ADP-ribosyltransferase PARP3-like isoform X2 n=1 Tax=Pistacia vera TaxID=55513 RepID=UPI0012633F7B|nr:protein ADP-ribosyltransferase PARP3-like isoform X2 [Pistacia vera]
MLFYGSLGRCPICNSKLEFEGKRYTCKGMYSEWSTCTFRTKDPQRREEPVKIPVDLEVSNDSKMDEKLGFEEDKGSEDNHNQNNTNNVENNNATMDSCGEDCVEAVMVEKAGEYLSCV